MKKAEGRGRPRIWWCPTGLFSFLPLHAAGATSKTTHNSLSEHAVSSYTPTLSALINARRGLDEVLASATIRVVLAGVPKTDLPDWPKISGVKKELKKLRKIVPESSILPLAGSKKGGPLVQAILDILPRASMLHLASHGHQDPDNPMQSGFAMKDDMLTIAALMRLKLSRAFFAFLSACETAKGDASQPDQTVHLAAAMLFVGFRSVIGTMWCVSHCCRLLEISSSLTEDSGHLQDGGRCTKPRSGQAGVCGALCKRCSLRPRCHPICFGRRCSVYEEIECPSAFMGAVHPHRRIG